MGRTRPLYWKIIIAILVLLALLGVCAVGWLWSGVNQNQQLFSASEKLGYRPAAQIAQVNHCWDLFSHCGLFLYYKTGVSQDQFEQLIEALAWEKISKMEVEGQSIFTDINIDTGSSLTVGGVEPTGMFPVELPLFLGQRWLLKDPVGATWTISYYPLASQRGPFAINGEPLNQNIVSILYQTR